MQITSTAFDDGQPVPEQYTCEGDNFSPALTFSGVPDDTACLALILDDPDAPSGTFSHWIVANLPPDCDGLPEKATAGDLPGNARQGTNDFGDTGYGGPCPPGDESHTYHFRLYALDAVPDLPGEVTRETLLRAIDGHVITQAELTGTFARS